MIFQDGMDLLAGVLQFTVAGFALRLNRIFGTARVGWSLFCAFALLALLHVIQSWNAGHLAGPFAAVKIQVIYSLVSLLLLIGMIHIETLFKERLRIEREETRLRSELETEVKKKTVYLTRAIEELQAEIDLRKRSEAELKAHIELLAALHHNHKTRTETAGQLQPEICF